MAFRFRLARVLEWYDRLYHLEAGRLKQCAERAAAANAELARHRESRLLSENQILSLHYLSGKDLEARESFRKQSALQEARLIQVSNAADKNLREQQSATLAAQRKVRLVEKLRDRRRDEFEYLAGRELEELAADSWLAGFARSLGEADHS
jgi:hypothetical protein